MKLKITLGLFTLAVFGMTSCRKTRYCNCYDSYGDFQIADTYLFATKKQAEVNCKNTASISGLNCKLD